MTEVKPKYWIGKSERLFTRMHPDVRMPLVIQSHKERKHPSTLIEQAIMDFISSGDHDASNRWELRPDFQACTYVIDQGVAQQLRRLNDATGETIQTLIHEALIRKLNLNVKGKKNGYLKVS